MLEVSLDIKFPSIMNKATRVGSASNVNFMGLAPVGCVGLRLNQDEKMLGFTAVLLALGAAAALLRKNGLVLQAYLVVISFLLPTTTSMIFSTFPCLELDTGGRWLLADKSIDCDGGSHVVMVAYVRANKTERALPQQGGGTAQPSATPTSPAPERAASAQPRRH
jgi:hypothetical protein